MHTFEIDVGIDPLIQKLDTDHNGQVDFEEFASFLFKEDHELDTALHKSGNRSLSPVSSSCSSYRGRKGLGDARKEGPSPFRARHLRKGQVPFGLGILRCNGVQARLLSINLRLACL